MKQKKDIRVQVTEKLLKDALGELLLENDSDINKITVTELVKKSGIGRSTFYLYYDSFSNMQEMLIKEFFDDFAEHIDEILDENISIHNKIEKLICYSFKATKSNRPFSVFAYKNSKYLSYVYTYGEYISNNIKNIFKNQINEDIIIMIDFLIGGTIKVLQTWAVTGMKRSPEEMTTFILKNFYGETIIKELPSKKH